MRGSRALGLVTVVVTQAIACNQLFGIEDPNLIERPTDSGSPDAPVEDVDAADRADAPQDAPTVVLPSLWMFAGVDLAAKKAEIAIASPADAGATLYGRLTLPSSDALAYASGGRAFLLNREDGTVFVLDRAAPTELSKVTRILTSPSNGAIKYDSNPYAVVVADDQNAFVIRYDSNEVMVVDLTDVRDGGVLAPKKSIDLSMFMSGSDPDGKVEMSAAVYVPSSKRVYVTLQRIQRFFPTRCTDEALVVAIDATTGAIADLDSSGTVDENDAIELVGKNPYSVALDEANGRLLVLNLGCSDPDGGAMIGRQVDAIDLGNRSVSVPISDPGVDLTALLYINPVDTYLQQGDGKWRRHIGDGGLGATATQIPIVPFVDRDGFIVGLVDETPDAAARSWGVARVDKQAQLGGSVLSKAFATVNAANVYLLSSALLQ